MGESDSIYIPVKAVVNIGGDSKGIIIPKKILEEINRNGQMVIGCRIITVDKQISKS